MLRLSCKARADLQHVYIQGVELFGHRQADIYIDGLLGQMDLIADFPRIGVPRPEFGPNTHVLSYKSHAVIYRVDEDQVFIRRVRHGLEDWQADAGTAPFGDEEKES
ncbi:type II toxin-antitoxin system RelE/ParE family toxin [uncultured Brevundimonas sp.]|uniref:type II toxin-antitoxin system RelE/ParE family toxin n=1 Tax=uncultured Brevundimonas sp. TaxID=213418 RepID=UPI002611AC15|nr:type II toxin-antitoxin system RelE/ParE family toxin [uncultured Brevundimonas sp.]